MLTPKSSHLVERVAERLLRSGALNDPPSQLLFSSAEAALADAPIRQTPNAGDKPLPASTNEPPASIAERAAAVQPIAHPAQRSSLFSRPRPSAAPPQAAAGQPTARDPVPLAPVPFAASPTAPIPATPLPAAPIPAASTPPADPATPTPTHPAAISAAALQRAGMIDWSRSRTRISEEFRLVQRQILRAAFGPDAQPGFSNLLLVTSARAGEGKSFIAANLAASIARQADHPVLLIDADAKRESICSSLGLAEAPGLLDLAASPRLDPAALIVNTPIQLLSILPIGRDRDRSAELFSATEMVRLLQDLGRRYADRLLILDAPPCLSTSDPALLAQLVGQILFVVEADRTQREEIEAALDLVQACPTITMVLNKQQTSARHSFGAYSSYYAN